MTQATPQHSTAQLSIGASAPAWTLAQQHVWDGLQKHEATLQNHLRALIWSFGLVTHRSGVESRLHELMSLTFDIALDKADHYDPNCSLAAWLRTIALNCVRDYKDRAGHTIPIAETRLVAQHAEYGSLSEAEMFDVLPRISSPQFEISLDELLPLVPSAYHTILKLHINDGLVGKSLALRLGTTEGAATTKFCRARAHLIRAFHALTTDPATEVNHP